jgi:hypothetical protein
VKLRRIHFLPATLGLIVCLIPFREKIRSSTAGAVRRANGTKTVEDRLAEHGGAARRRLQDEFQRIDMPYPPKRLCLVGLKQERILEVWVAGAEGGFRHLLSYPILAASGTLGPKLAEGDQQVPEGIYKLESLNPNSLYHLSLRINYPNGFDRKKGAIDGRKHLGSDIMIHGKAVSAGCLAMGDRAIEELFVMSADLGIEAITVLLSPVDFRKRQLPPDMPARRPGPRSSTSTFRKNSRT